MNRKLLRILFIAIIFILSYGFIAYKILHFSDLKSFKLAPFITNPGNLYFIIILLLMILNWNIEALKWQKLIHKIQPIPYLKALIAVFAGITFGVFTPNRIGEIGGRIYFMDRGKKTYGVLATGIGSYAQFITTIAMGLFGIFLFILFYPDLFYKTYFLNKLTTSILIIILCFLFWSFYNIKRIKPVLMKLPMLKRKSEQIEYISYETGKSLSIILLLSMMRYIVFFIQFFLLLKMFGVEIDIIQAIISITLTYLFLTLIPTTTLVELGVRGSLAIFFVGIFSENTLGIVLASIFIWIINIAIPAIVGSFFLLKTLRTNKPISV